jgi:AraC-like DNA-binding protein
MYYMKLIIERLNKDAKSSFVLQKDVYSHYPTPWHYHPEYELVLVLRSSGEKIIGDHMSSFTDGDLVFLGPNLPHVYHNSQIYYEENSNLTAEAIVIHFNIDFLGNSFFNIPEMEAISGFLEKSVMGFAIRGNARQLIAQKMNDMLEMSGSSRIIELLSILHILTETKEKEKLASPGFIQDFKTSGSEQITKVCDYIMKNFTYDITLNQVAKIANMSPNAFCNFFKQRTRKTFVNFLNEVRIGYACKLLSGEQHNISEICYLSGFHNLSNFNRQFIRTVNKTPHQYKRDILRTGIKS